MTSASIRSTRVRVGEAVEGGGEDANSEEGNKKFFHV